MPLLPPKVLRDVRRTMTRLLSGYGQVRRPNADSSAYGVVYAQTPLSVGLPTARMGMPVEAFDTYYRELQNYEVGTRLLRFPQGLDIRQADRVISLWPVAIAVSTLGVPVEVRPASMDGLLAGHTYEVANQDGTHLESVEILAVTISTFTAEFTLTHAAGWHIFMETYEIKNEALDVNNQFLLKALAQRVEVDA